MFRLISLSIFVLFFVSSCSEPDERPVLSGLLWGGEGRRLVIEAASDSSFIADTIIIDHLGRFSWTPDTVIPGFYRLSNTSGEGLLLLLDSSQMVVLDAQFVSYPQKVKVEGFAHANDLYAIEKNSLEWLNQIKEVASQTRDSGWVANPSSIDLLHNELDSVDGFYREQALKLSDEPLVRMFALLQGAGNRYLFDPWNDRELFLEVDSLLRDFGHLREVARFAEQVKEIKEQHHVVGHTLPGNRFPKMNVYNKDGDPVEIYDFMGDPLYLHFYNSLENFTNEITQRHLNDLQLLQQAGWKVCLIFAGPEDPPSSIGSEEFFAGYINIDSATLMKDLGVNKFPVNFMIDHEAVIVAKNIWDSQLSELVRDVTQ